MKKNKGAEDNESPRRRATSFRQRIFFLCRSLLRGAKSKEVQEPAVSQVNDKTDFNKVFDEHSGEVVEHMEARTLEVAQREYDELMDGHLQEADTHPDAGKENSIRNEGWEDEQPAESQLADSFIKYSVEIDEYLFFLELALSVAKTHLDSTAPGFIGMIIDYFNARREDYNKIKLIRPDDKKYLIFAGAIGVDVAAAKEYDRLVAEDIAKYGVPPPSNEAAARFLYKNEILYFEDGRNNSEGIINLLTKSDAYASLREAAYASYVSLFPKKKVDIPKKGKEEKLADKVSYLKKKVSDMENASSDFNEIHAIIFQNISDEVNNHLGRFIENDYGKGVISLTDSQKVFLTLLLFQQIGMSNLTATDVAHFMASVLGGNNETYRKVVVKCTNSKLAFGYNDKNHYKEARKGIATVFDSVKGVNHDKLKPIIKLIEGQKSEDLSGLISRPIKKAKKTRKKIKQK